MKIHSIQTGFGKEVLDQISLNIYVAGCKNNKKCDMKKCHNQELRNFNVGVKYTKWFKKIIDFLNDDLFDCVVILGGEPLDQDIKEIEHLLNVIKVSKFFRKKRNSLKIYMYTGYSYEDKKKVIDSLFKKGIDGICTGEYNETECKKKWIYKGV